MPSIHIPEGPFNALVDEYGYAGAKERVKTLAREEAERLDDE